MAIPKHIFSVWLSNSGTPEVIEKCLASQKKCAEMFGYEYTLYTLDNCFRDCDYMRACIASSQPNGIKYTKASDYLRFHYLYEHGGFYLDADVEVLEGKNFDELLKHKFVVARENNGFLGAAVVGSESKYPFAINSIDYCLRNFRGDDEKCFEAFMEPMTYGKDRWNWYQRGFEVLPNDYFYPYDHQKGIVDITNNTITYHKFTKLWK